MFVVKSSSDLRKAKERAAENRPEVRVVSFDEYKVRGSAGNFYTVRVGLYGHCVGVDCDCIGGQYGSACYHAAAALEERARIAASGAPLPEPARDRNLAVVEADLRFIRRRAENMGAEFDIMEDILRAVRSSLQGLFEYELSLQPAVQSEAA